MTSCTFNFIRDTAPVSGVVHVPNVVEVNPSLPVKTIPELIAHAKANPGALSFASAGIGTTSHMAGELFKAMTGVNIVHVAYRGDGPAMTDLIGGQVQVGVRDHGRVNRPYQRRQAAAAGGHHDDARAALPDIPTVERFRAGI